MNGAQPGVGGGAARHVAGDPAQKRAPLQTDWGFSDLEMHDTVGAGALGLVEETIAAGAVPSAAEVVALVRLVAPTTPASTSPTSV